MLNHQILLLLPRPLLTPTLILPLIRNLEVAAAAAIVIAVQDHLVAAHPPAVAVTRMIQRTRKSRTKRNKVKTKWQTEKDQMREKDLEKSREADIEVAVRSRKEVVAELAGILEREERTLPDMIERRGVNEIVNTVIRIRNMSGTETLQINVLNTGKMMQETILVLKMIGTAPGTKIEVIITVIEKKCQNLERSVVKKSRPQEVVKKTAQKMASISDLERMIARRVDIQNVLRTVEKKMTGAGKILQEDTDEHLQCCYLKKTALPNSEGSINPIMKGKGSTS